MPMTDAEWDRYTRNTVDYEWVASEIDEHDDVIDNYYHEATSKGLKEALELTKTRVDKTGVRWRVELWRNLGSESDGIEDRGYAELVDGKLPEEFDSGHKVPTRFHKQTAAIQ